MLDTGFPRNDIFFDTEKQQKARSYVRRQYGIDEDKYLVLYAPTFRDGHVLGESDALSQFDPDKVMEAIEKTFNSKAICLFRGHLGTAYHPESGYLDVSDYQDMQEILCAADMMITDYSSSMWDFSFTGRPCLLFVPDLDDYVRYRGLYTNIYTWGFPVCKTLDELICAIEHFDPTAYAEAMQRHHEALGSFERGTATQEVSEFIMEYTGNI